MKTRMGFVSNSSSSSFIIAWKGDYDEEDLTFFFKKICKIPNDSPLHGIHEAVFNCFMNSVEREFNDIDDYNKWCNENCYDRDEHKEIVKLLENGFTIKLGSVSTNTSNQLEYFFANKPIKYESDDLVVINQGNY